MFVKRNRRHKGDAVFTSVLLVQGARVPAGKRPRGRPRKDAPPPRTRVVHRVLANLSKLPPELVDLVDAYCKGGVDACARPEAVCLGPGYGQLAGLFALAQEIGVARALGGTRRGLLALLLVLARVARRRSPRSAVRWSEGQAVREVLGLGHFDEQDLYETLGWLGEQQPHLERDFRTLETGLPELREVFLRKETRTRGLALVTMLGVKLARDLGRRVADLGLTAQDALDRLGGVRLVTFADPSLGLWRLPTRHAKEQQEVLDRLPPLRAPMLSRK